MSPERQAILALADAVAYIASRCWEQIGTRDVETIVASMQKLTAALEKKKGSTDVG